MRHFRFDPFAHHRPEDSTVGALRARARANGVDVSTQASATASSITGEKLTKISDLVGRPAAPRAS
jgi:hypothetical protein